jgi:membrane fusion protein, multidrug efflux system
MSPEPTLEMLEEQYPATSEPVIAQPSNAIVPKVCKGLLRKTLVVLTIACAAGFAAWKIHQNITEATPAGRRSGSNGDRAVPVMAVPVQQEEMPIYLTAPGTVTAYYSVTIRTRIDGQLLSVNIHEGQAVRKGQLLAQIDPAPYQAVLAQAEGQLAKDQAAAVYAKAAAERYKTLYAAGVVSKDREQTQAAAAGQAEGAILADQAAIQAAKVNLAFAHITSPIDGVVGLRQVDPGNIVHASDATGLILVTQLKPISVIFTLPEDQLPDVQKALRNGSSLAVEAYDHAETTLLGNGKLLTLDNQIDTATGTDKVKALFDNKDGALFPNQFVNVRLVLRHEPNALVIPASAVQSGSAGSFVYVVKQGDPTKHGDFGTGQGSEKSKTKHKEKPQAGRPNAQSGDNREEKERASDGKFYVEVRPIAVDVTEDSQVIVSSGLSAGDQVVVDGLEKLKDGSIVLPRQSGSRSGGHSSSKHGTDKSDAKKDGGEKGMTPETGEALPESGAADGKQKHHKQGSRP